MSAKTLNRDILPIEEALTIARREVADFEFNDDTSLAGYLPSIEVNDIEYEIDETVNDEGVIADWRSFNGQATADTQGKGGRLRGGLQPIAANAVIDEYKKLRSRKDADDLLMTEAGSLVARSARRIAKAVNFQRANAIVNAKVNIDGPNGLHEEITFNRLPEFDTVAPVLFSDPAADPIEYIATLCDQYEEVNGFRPAKILAPSRVIRMIYSHPNVVLEASDSPNAENKRRIPNSLIQAVLDEFDIPPFERTTQKKYQKYNFANRGEIEQHYLFPQDSIVLVGGEGDPADPLANPYGRTFWGTTVSAELPEFQAAVSEHGVPGIVAAVYEEGWPYNMEVIADALVTPIVISPNYTLKAKVV